MSEEQQTEIPQDPNETEGKRAVNRIKAILEETTFTNEEISEVIYAVQAKVV